MAQPRQVNAAARKVLRANPSVIGFSETLKPKVVRGTPTRRMAIRVYVEKKVPKARVPQGQLVPKTIGGIPTDVEELGRVEPLQAPPNRGKFRPLEGGASGIHRGGTAATLGYFMRDKKAPPPPRKPQWYALSNAHVLHTGTAQNETIQPSPQDGGLDPQDWVGREYLYTYDGIDAAIAKIDTGAVARVIGLPTPVGTAAAEEDLVVAKSGRTTGVTYGTVIDDGFELNQPHWGTSPGAVRFRRVILIRNRQRDFVQGGDSGSLLMDPVRETAVGLVFGMSIRAGESRGMACPIDAVLRAFPLQTLVMPGETYP